MRKVLPDAPSAGQESPSQQLTAALQGAPLYVDDFARARMEKNLIEAWRSRGALAVQLGDRPRDSLRPRRLPSRGVWIGSLAVSAAAGVLLGIYALRSHDVVAAGTAPDLVAHFEVVIDDGAVQSGYVSEGQMLESGKHGHIEVGLAQSRVDISPDSRVRFERLSRQELRLSLVTGRVEVAYHPEHKGEEHMSIETRAARVLVVGTRFEVTADAQGDTQVSVSEGVVQVVPRRGGVPLFLHPGEHTKVAVEPEADSSAAVRAGIERRIRDDARPELGEDDHEDKTTGADTLSDTTDTADAPGAEREAKHASLDRDGSPETRLEAARSLLIAGKHTAAREKLQRIARSTLPTGDRVEALILIAESYTAQGQISRATDAYREAVRIAPRHPAGHNALFALARLLERYTDDRSSAGAAYREYLQRAPSGALAPQAREALCRLGDAASCD